MSLIKSQTKPPISGSKEISIPSTEEQYKKRYQIFSSRKLIYEDILKDCVHQINELNEEEKTFCYFTIPLEIINKPNFKFIECVNYVVLRLREKNYYVKYVVPNILYINWNVNINLKSSVTSKQKSSVSTNSLINNALESIRKIDQKYKS